MKLYLIAYDIQEDRGRRKMAQWLEDEGGTRINYSVFECELSARRKKVFLNKLNDWIDPDTDRIAIYRICKSCASQALYLPLAPDEDEPHTLIV